MHENKITLLRSDNVLVVKPTTKKISGLLIPQLTYIEKKFFRGKDKFIRRRMGLPEFEETIWQCYGFDHKDRLSTSFGFYERIKKVLEAHNYEVKLQWSTQREALIAEEKNKSVYKPDWNKIEEFVNNGFEFRPKQKHILELMTQYENGRIDCHGGYGKGTSIMLACLLFPKAKFDIITKRIAVLHQRLYPELAMNLPSVGLIGGGKKIKNKRVMCISADSLHHGRPDVDFVLVDEGHEACTDKFAESLGNYHRARMWAFSATWDMRLDNKNLRGEAIFGPIRVVIPYTEGVVHDIVVPIEVRWNDVIMDDNPCADQEGTEKDRLGLWSNSYRNKLIRQVARKYNEDTQVLITVNTLEHALHLKKLMPEYELVYAAASQSNADWDWFKENDLISEDFEPMTTDRRAELTKRFSNGTLKKAIATTVWNVGVDFRHLQVLIRADGGSSSIADTQIPCRNARKHKLGDHLKVTGKIHDFKDQFDRGLNAKANRRRKNYEKQGWRQIDPNPKRKSKLRSKMKWGSK